MCAVKLSPPLISNLTRDFKFREDTNRFPYVRGFLVNVNILLNIIILQSIATATINSGTSGWKQEIITGQCPIIALGGRYCQNLTVNLTRPGSSFSTTRPHPPPPPPPPLKQRLKIAESEPPARNAGIRNLYLVGYLYPRCVRNDKISDYLLLLLSVSCESRDRPTEFDKLPYIKYLVEVFAFAGSEAPRKRKRRWNGGSVFVTVFYLFNLKSQGFNQYHMQQKD